MQNSLFLKVSASRFILTIVLAGCFHCTAMFQVKAAEPCNHQATTVTKQKHGTKKRAARNTPLIQAMERFKEAVRTQNGQLLLTCFSRRRPFHIYHPLEKMKHKISFMELATDVKNRPPDFDPENSVGTWANYFLDPIPGLDDFTDFFFDYDDWDETVDGPQPQWELVPGRTMFVHDYSRDSKNFYPSITWRKEGRKWVIHRIVH